MTLRQIAIAAKSPAWRSGLLLAVVPLGMSLVTAGLVEMDKLVAARRRQLERLEAAVRATQAHLDGLVGSTATDPNLDVCGERYGHDGPCAMTEAAQAAAPA